MINYLQNIFYLWKVKQLATLWGQFYAKLSASLGIKNLLGRL